MHLLPASSYKLNQYKGSRELASEAMDWKFFRSFVNLVKQTGKVSSQVPSRFASLQLCSLSQTQLSGSSLILGPRFCCCFSFSFLPNRSCLPPTTPAALLVFSTSSLQETPVALLSASFRFFPLQPPTSHLFFPSLLSAPHQIFPLSTSIAPSRIFYFLTFFRLVQHPSNPHI